MAISLNWTSSLAVGVVVALQVGVAAASHNPEPTSHRENIVLLPDGRQLVVTQTDDDEAGLAMLDEDGDETTIVNWGVCLLDCGDANKPLIGIGSNPHANSDGVVVFQATMEANTSDGVHWDEREDPQAIFMVGTDGDITTIVESRINGEGTAVSGDTICGLEPRPQINDAGQIGFGAGLDENGNTEGGNLCEDRDRHDSSYGKRGAILRYTPGEGTELMLLADASQNASFVTVPAGIGAPPGSYAVRDVNILENSAKRMNESGQMLVKAFLDRDGDIDYQSDWMDTLIVLNDPGDYAVVAVEGNSPYRYVNGGVINDDGAVLFRTSTHSSDREPAQLHIWTAEDGIETIAETGDTIPGTANTFFNFTPHLDLNEDGNAAFVATINGNNNDGVFFYNGGTGQITEIARDTSAPGGGTSSFAGLSFDEIASVAVLTDENEVYFVAEDEDDEPICDVDGGEWTALYRWTLSGGLKELIREGQLLDDGARVLNLFVNSPELRRQANASGQFVILAAVDASGGCDINDERALVLPQDASTFNYLDFFNRDSDVVVESGFGALTGFTLAGLLGGLLWRRRRFR